MIKSIVFIGLIICLSIQCILWLVFYIVGKRQGQQKGNATNLAKLSIVICARNALVQLQKNLPLVLAQDYPDYEVILVDDGSRDGSTDYLKTLANKHPRLRIINYTKKPNESGKRPALAAGIRQAKYDWLLFTDADCKVSSEYWIREMMGARKPSSKIILGIAPYRLTNSWVVRFAAYENLYTAILYSASAGIGLPYMGVGRNLLYHRSALDLSVLDDRSHASGDDDLMVNRVSNANNTGVSLSPNGMCISNAPISLTAFFNQKRRHLSTGIKYKTRDWIWLNTINGSQSLFHLFSLIYIWFNPWLVIGLNILRWNFMFLANKPLYQICKNRRLLPFLPLMDYVLSLYFLVMVPFVFVRKKGW